MTYYNFNLLCFFAVFKTICRIKGRLTDIIGFICIILTFYCIIKVSFGWSFILKKIYSGIFILGLPNDKLILIILLEVKYGIQ